MNGNVKFFNPTKGFGFITAEDGKDYFVHISDLPDGITLEEDDAVTFEVEQTEKGLKASNLKLSDGSSDSSDDESDSSSESDDEEEDD